MSPGVSPSPPAASRPRVMLPVLADVWFHASLKRRWFLPCLHSTALLRTCPTVHDRSSALLPPCTLRTPAGIVLRVTTGERRGVPYRPSMAGQGQNCMPYLLVRAHCFIEASPFARLDSSSNARRTVAQSTQKCNRQNRSIRRQRTKCRKSIIYARLLRVASL